MGCRPRGAYEEEIAKAFTDTLRELAHPDPEAAARTISLLVDGSVAHSIVYGDSTPIKDARRMVEMLLDRSS
ncbi:TetR family transcriptional regulator C-terminal domain-containing protein [Kutzneria buriramensis]|uniref:TetR family transcriptional regulator n=1 Tax=Kutzneria buriramensis TaxID=1045776 RepID=A0A3E0H8A3_9PSEU|nr:TetR family transcriptional regulator C-terminal domain-containing protein [Kutzneria buriramensis]REH39374.1 TetR family transcriptional regulator [Kutzneria buriramensis]